MKVSKTVVYGIKATLLIARDQGNSPIPCSHLAELGGMPNRFLLQILRQLVRHGVLQSTRGLHGGYRLTRLPVNISLLEVIEAIEGPLVSYVPLGCGLSETVQESLEVVLIKVASDTRKQLHDIKLSQLLDNAGKYGII